MAAIDTARFRKMLDEIDAEAKETDSTRRLEELESKLSELNARIDELPAEIQAQLRETRRTVAEELDDAEQPTVDEPEPEPEPTMRTRPGRKRGQVYQDKPGEPAYVYDGDDEPDRVPVEEAGAE